VLSVIDIEQEQIEKESDLIELVSEYLTETNGPESTLEDMLKVEENESVFESILETRRRLTLYSFG